MPKVGAAIKPQFGDPLSIRFTPADRHAANEIILAGWATNFTGAIRYALKFTSERVARDERSA